MATKTIPPVTLPAAPLAPPAPPVEAGTHYRFTAADIERMVEVGILTESDRVELIDGEVLVMSAVGRKHVRCVYQLNWLLSRQLSDEYRVSLQSPLLLNDDTEPEPDVVVIRYHDEIALPSPTDTMLVMEVSDSSLAYDRATKLPRYAIAGIPEVWIIDLTTNTLERHTEPSNGEYRRTDRVRAGETIASAVLPTLNLPVDTVLG